MCAIWQPIHSFPLRLTRDEIAIIEESLES